MKDSYLFYHKHTHLTSHSTFTVQAHIKHSRCLCRNVFQMIFFFSPLPSIPSLPHAGEMKTEVRNPVIELFLIRGVLPCKYGAGECKLKSAAGRHGAARNGDVGFRWDTAQSCARSCLVFLPFKPKHTSSEQCLTGTGSWGKKKKKRKGKIPQLVLWFSLFFSFSVFFYGFQSVNTSPRLWNVGDVLTPLWILLLALFPFLPPHVIV